MGSGLALGIGVGVASGQTIERKKLKALMAEGKITVTDAEGNAIEVDQLIALLSGRSKKV